MGRRTPVWGTAARGVGTKVDAAGRSTCATRVGLMLFLVSATMSAQVMRTETRVVLVDVIASDKKGASVRDLTAADFRVWEDGKEQKISSISRESNAIALNAVPSVADQQAAKKHYVVMLFDNASMTTREQAYSRQSAMRLIDLTAAASVTAPFTAVMSFGGALRVAQTFTEDIARAKLAITKMPAFSSGATDDAVAGRLSSDFSNRDNIRALETLVKNLESVPGRKSLIWFTPGIPLTSEYTAAVDLVVKAANQSNIAIYPVNMRQPTVLGSTPSAEQPGAAGRGRFDINAIRGGRGTPSELSGVDTPASQMNTASMIAGLNRLAEKTGGFVVSQPDDSALLTRAAGEQAEYYLLGYTPPESAPGTCHKLRVEVSRKNVELRSRAEYCNRAPADILSGNATERVLEARALEPNAPPSAATPGPAAAAPANIAATMQATYFYAGSNVARVVSVLELDPAPIAFKKDNGRLQASIDILGLAQKADGSTAARFSDIVKLDFATQAEVDAFHQAPYRYEGQFDIAAGDYNLTVAFAVGVSATGTGGSLGKLSAPLRIPSYSNVDFAMSGLVLSHQFRAANDVDSALDQLLIDDHKKLMADDTEITAAGSRKLRRETPAGVFLEIYEPLLASAATRDTALVAIQLRVLERGTGVQKVDTGAVRLDLNSPQGSRNVAIRSGTAVISLGLAIPLRTLASGSYTLEVQAANGANKGAVRTLDFEVE